MQRCVPEARVVSSRIGSSVHAICVNLEGNLYCCRWQESWGQSEVLRPDNLYRTILTKKKCAIPTYVANVSNTDNAGSDDDILKVNL